MQKDYHWYKIDKEMWNTGHLIDSNELYKPTKEYDGLVILKNSNGKLLSQGHLNQGIPSGLWIFWYANGQIAKEYNIPGIEHISINPAGLIREWYADGTLAIEGCYDERRGAMIGTWRRWNETGKASLEEGKRYDDGVLRAVFFKNIDSVVFLDGTPYKDAPTEKDGYRRYMILLPEGTKAYLEGYYKNSLRQEWWKFWMYDGRIISLTYYKDGVPGGFCFIVDPGLLRSYNSHFREFLTILNFYPSLVYFKDGLIITREEYEKRRN